MIIHMLKCDSCGEEVDVGNREPTIVLCGCDTNDKKPYINNLDAERTPTEFKWDGTNIPF